MIRAGGFPLLLPAMLAFAGPARGSEHQFVRGDLVELTRPGVSDALRILAHLFAPESRPPLPGLDAADVNDDGRIDIADPVHLLHWLFLGGSAPAYPYPICGRDETPDDLGCEDHDLCRPATQPARFFGIELDAEAVFFVIERSEFVIGNGELAVAKRAFISWLAGAPWATRYGIVFADAGALRYPRSFEPAIAEDRGSIAAATQFASEVPGGQGACPLLAIAEALEWAAHSGVERNSIVYVGSGGVDCPPEPDGAYRARVLRDVQELNRGRAAIQTIGVLISGTEGDAFLAELAAQNGGEYLRVER